MLKAKYKKSHILFFVILLLGAYSVFIEPWRLVTTEWTVATDKWKSDRPLKIVLLADIHAIRPWMTPDHIRRIVDETNKLKPDLVLLMGDYVATHPFGLQVKPEEGVAPYKALSANCGVFAILGNHDLHKSVGWPEAMEDTGIPLLRNSSRKLNCEGRSFWLAGLDELWYGNADLSLVERQITTDDPVILMMHQPDSFPEVSEKFALSVAGHTHAGQVRFPIIGALSIVVPSRYGDKYDYGHIHEDEKDMIVSAGLGNTGLPIRFLCPPEITVITLQKP